MLLHPLNNIEITNYFYDEHWFNGVFYRNNSPRIKDGAHALNFDEKNSKGTHWVSLLINKIIAIYFVSFRIEYIPQEVLNKITDKSFTHNIFRKQDNKAIMCGFYCISFIECMHAEKTFLDYTNNYKNIKLFKDKYGRRSLE